MVYFTPVATSVNIVLYQRIQIVQCPEFVTISWIDSQKIIALSFLKSSASVMSAFFMDFLDESKRISLATTPVSNITLSFYFFYF